MDEQKKTITEEIEAIKDDICQNYCKWPYQWDDSNGDLWDSDICNNCPLNRL